MNDGGTAISETTMTTQTRTEPCNADRDNHAQIFNCDRGSVLHDHIPLMIDLVALIWLIWKLVNFFSILVHS